MNLAPYIPLSGFVVNLLFAFFVFSRGPRVPANRVYLLLALSIANWNLGCYHLLVVTTASEALFWARFVMFGCIFGVAAFFHLAMIVAGFKVGAWMPWLYGFQVILALTNFTPLFIRDVQYLGASGWYACAGPMFYVFVVPFSLMFGSIFVLWHRRRSLPSFKRRQLTPLIAGQAMLSVLGANDLMPILGITTYPFTNVAVYPWGSLAAVFYGVITAYSVLQHQLLDIQAGLSRYAAHFIRFAFLFSTTLGLLLIASAFTEAFSPAAFGVSLLVFMVGAILATLLFPRLFGGQAVERIERHILGDRFEYQDRMRAFTQMLPWQSDLKTLLDEMHDLFTRSLRLRSYDLVLRDEANRTFTRNRSYPSRPEEPIPELRFPSPVFEYFSRPDVTHITLNAHYGEATTSGMESRARTQLERFDADFCFSLVSDRELVGLLFVAGKNTGEPFTSTDIHLLTGLAKNLSLIVNQIRLKDEVLRAQEFDMLGRMSRGMAHDLNNLLTPISTLLQLANEHPERHGVDEELLAVALRNVGMVRAYIKEALFFSEHSRPDLQVSRLDELIEATVDGLASDQRRGVEVNALTPGPIEVEIDEVLIQRLLANLISNAIDASQPGDIVHVTLERLIKTEATRDWLRLKVIDQGEGIARENLDRVTAPYFTTKDRGDDGRGFGLGLAICRKIVALHGGKLTIHSERMRGTTVQVDLPSSRVKSKPESLAPAAA
jgi:signal transduction histidine kinase